jgi:hypothetical protein
VRHAIDQAFVEAFRWVMLLSAGLAVLSAAAAFVMIRGPAAAPARAPPSARRDGRAPDSAEA